MAMTEEDLKKKLQAATEKVHKIEATIERHKKGAKKKRDACVALGIEDPDHTDRMKFAGNRNQHSQDCYWAMCEYEDKLGDIKNSEKKLKEAKVIAENWANKLRYEVHVQNTIENNVPKIIKDFMNDWKKKSIDWYMRRYKVMDKNRKELKKKQKYEEDNFARTLDSYKRFISEGEPDAEALKHAKWISSTAIYKYLKEIGMDDRSIDKQCAAYGHMVNRLDDFRTDKEKLEFLDREMEHEKKVMMIDLMKRINKIVGNITDASNLGIGEKGEINGFIIGDAGKANINTISAGGYNIQCFHFRTLVNKVR